VKEAPNSKNQIPKTKSQKPNPKQIPNPKIQTPMRARGVWNLEFVWDLEFGFWDWVGQTCRFAQTQAVGSNAAC
jgi:hypothetical protein